MTGITKTRFLAALLIFSLVCILASSSRLFAPQAQDYEYQSWTSWTIEDFLQQRQRANVVFLGSSLMLVPLAGADADFLNRRLDGSRHHYSAYFEQKFKEATQMPLRSFSFALPGEMPSDAYLILRNLLKADKKPDLIIYGIGPRDLLDNTLQNPAATDPYRFLSRFGDLSSISAKYLTEFFQKLDFELGQAFYLYGIKSDLTNGFIKCSAKALDIVLPLPSGVKAQSPDDRRAMLPAFRPYEVLEGQSWFRPSTAADHKIVINNLEEYKKRYGKMNWSTYLSQMEFLAALLNMSKQRGIHVVLVTMPLTAENRSLISKPSWQAYHSGVKALARAKGADLVDLAENPEFSNADFMDTVHLHSGGGKRLIDKLCQTLSKDENIISLLKSNDAIANNAIKNKKIAEKEKGARI